MTRLASIPSALLMLALAAGPARAQFGPPPPDQPDRTLDARTRAAVVESLAVQVKARYVFADRGAELARALRCRLAARQYDRIASAKEFADSLTAHMQAVTNDLHLRVHYRHEPLPAQPAADGPPPPEELRRMRESGRQRNHGFEKVERLAGNVGLLDLRMFSGDPDAQPVAIAAMNFLANADAIVIDLRRNGGGSPAMIQTLLTYFVAPDDRLHINDFYQRGTDELEQWHTSAQVPGPRLHGKPLYVLTSRRTASAAEEFAYDVQTHRLGTIVGAVSAGGANPGGLFRLHDHFAAFIATGRAINPVTKTNWEGVGVRPDVEVAPELALREAHVAALRRLLAGATDPERRAALEQALERAEQAPAEAPEEFVRPQRRRAG